MSKPVKLILCIVACIAAGAIGALFTDTGSWYQALNKPIFNPPSWLFGPVWTTLYILIGIAGGLAWSTESSQTPTAMRWYWIQLGLNTLWSFSFFGLQNPLVGLINILFLLAAIIMTMIYFFKVKQLSGWLMMPYLAWVSFAKLLNASIWWLN